MRALLLLACSFGVHAQVATNPTHYGDPKTGCESDEQAVREVADKSEGDQVLDLLRKLVKKENGSGGTSSNASWNSLKGPMKGVRYRGGAPPAPPAWKYQANDVRAYERFERKVRLWELQARHWMSRAEAGLALYASLQGEAEQQLEFLDTDKVYSQEGVQYVLDELKAAFQQLKRHYLHDYEHIARYPQESLRSFVNRYKRCEAALLGIGVNVSLTYDEEARGSRLLDRCRLSSDQQPLILVGTSQKMSFSVVAQALTMQYPDYKPPPPVVQRDGAPKGTSKGHKGSFGTTSSSSTSPHTSTTASSATSYRKGDGKSRFGDGRPRRVFQTITEDQQAEDSSGNHDYINDDDEYLLPDSTDNQIEHAVLAAEHQPDDDEEAGDSAGELDELTRVLTVTAKKLASMNQGRKFRNAPKKSIEQRKQESLCAACGQLGHWAGDNACQVSSKGQKAGKGKGSPDKANKGFDGGKKVFTVNHYTGFDIGDEFEFEEHSPFSPHEVLVVFQNATHVNFKSSKAAHFMILDTACQKSCCGHEWYIEHQKILERNDLHAVLHPQSERFQFGAGEPLVSKTLALLPIGIDKRMCVFGVNILDASIPFLGSLNLMNQMGLQLDLANQTAIIGAFDNHKVRERLGQFRSMQGVLPTLEVERRRRRMEVGWLLLKSLAVAAVTLDGSGNSYHGLRGTLGPDSEPGHGLPSGTGATLRDLWSDWDGSAGAFATDSAQAQANIQSSINDIFSRGPWSDCRSTAGLRLSDERQPEPRPRSEHLRVGVRKQLSGSINKNVKMLENEVYILNKLPNKETLSNKVDLMELYSGEARPTSLAPRYGLTSIQPFELQDGYDLDAPHVRGWVEEGQTRKKPLLLLLGPPCTNWCIFNENLNYRHRMDQLSALRAQERPRVKWSAERCLHQANRGDLFFFENPLKSRIWSEPAVQKLMNHPDTVKVTCDGGAFGAQDEDGYNITKTYGVLTNSKARRMTKQEKTFCRPPKSKHVMASQVHPIKMVHAILQGLREEALQRDPIRFEPPQIVFYARPVADEERWREALDMVKKTFGASANKSVQLTSTSSIYKIVADLVPWELTRVQIAATPAVRRMPTDVLYTHRGLAVVYNDSTIDVESEDLSMIEHPKQRFARPVAHGIFFYGNAEDDPKPVDEAAVPPERRIPGLRTDCALRTTTGDKYCALICQSDSDCGTGSCQKIMGVGLCTYDATKKIGMETTMTQVAVATNPSHYGNPKTGCESDEQAVRVQGLSGDFCSPKCSSSGSCPSDVPKGDSATPECALRTTTGDKYCALICQSDSDCGLGSCEKIMGVASSFRGADDHLRAWRQDSAKALHGYLARHEKTDYSSTMASSDQEWTKVEDMRQSRMGPSGLRGCERHQGEKSSDESMAETEVYVSDEGRWKKASEVFPDHPGARHSCDTRSSSHDPKHSGSRCSRCQRCSRCASEKREAGKRESQRGSQGGYRRTLPPSVCRDVRQSVAMRKSDREEEGDLRRASAMTRSDDGGEVYSIHDEGARRSTVRMSSALGEGRRETAGAVSVGVRARGTGEMRRWNPPQPRAPRDLPR
eukprot:g11527.t1